MTLVVVVDAVLVEVVMYTHTTDCGMGRHGKSKRKRKVQVSLSAPMIHLLLKFLLAHEGSTILYDHGDETISAGGDVIKARDRIYS